MSNHRLCEDPVVYQCPEDFRLQASGWINSANIGDTDILTPPPAGIRLRWNCPFLISAPLPARGILKTYSILRSERLDEKLQLTDYDPTVGHTPRSRTPVNRWVKLMKLNEKVYTLEGAEQCSSIEAIYFELPATSPTTKVSLVCTDGTTKVTGYVSGGDKFYFELGGINRVVFSSDTGSLEVKGLSLKNYPGDLEGISFTEIARVNAEYWSDANLIDVSMRLANADGEPFISIKPNEWEEIRTIGQRISEAYQNGNAPLQNDIDALRISATIHWEIGTLIGWGFVDGEHPPGTGPDTIINMLTNPDGGHYCYYISAEFQTSTGATETEDSMLYFTRAVEMNGLAPVEARSKKIPITRSELTNIVEPSDGPVISSGLPVEQFYCETEWELNSVLPISEIMISIPNATKSVIKGTDFNLAGEFYSGSNTNVIEFRGLQYYQNRSHRFEVPYFDSKVWLDLIATDSWGRRGHPSSTEHLQPVIDYDGKCVPLSTGKCDSGSQSVLLTLDQKLTWKADDLSTYSHGKIEMLIKNPLKEPLAAQGRITPAFPAIDGNWVGDISDFKVEQNQLSRLIGGTLVIGGFTAQIIALVAVGIDKVRCTFDAVVQCGGAELYATDSGFAEAYLYENPNSPNLWLEIGSIAVSPEGMPVAYDKEIGFRDIEKVMAHDFDHSMTLNFATRLSFSFNGNDYLGPVSVPIAIPYLHPVPKAPAICFNLQQLGQDYYGRSIVRAVVERCPPISTVYKSKLSIAPGIETDPQVFSEASTEGILGQQYPVIANQSLWDIFPVLQNLPEGSQFTAGIKYFRDADGGEGPSKLDNFEIRKVDA